MCVCVCVCVCVSPQEDGIISFASCFPELSQSGWSFVQAFLQTPHVYGTELLHVKERSW